MAKQITSRKTAKALSFAFFLFGIAALSFLGKWWPGIMLAIGLPLALREYLLGRRYDMAVTIFVFVGVFVTVQFNVAWKIILPILFTLGGIYVLFREYLENKEITIVEEEEDINIEIEEDQHKK
ncbi:MAG TPA: hypothetical protein VI728_00770 [Syntrophales bacterium]|nr:hypothetical protein [Rhabdochlamydiaceae bacterium]HLE16796.1 hypothetical protein [Syntrophales bacterium]